MFLEFFNKGGVVMWPLLVCSIIALTVIVERTVFWLTYTRKRTSLEGLTRGLNLLDTIITISPLLGILGTVLGIIESFDLLQAAGIRNPTAIIGGVAEALITTAAGLTIAIPSLVFYNLFLCRAQKIIDLKTELSSTKKLGTISSTEEQNA